jgi:hypothetical protein
MDVRVDICAAKVRGRKGGRCMREKRWIYARGKSRGANGKKTRTGTRTKKKGPRKSREKNPENRQKIEGTEERVGA